MNNNWITFEINIEIETKSSHLPHVSSGTVFLQSVERVCNKEKML
jgi:hypothetical protein